MNDHLWLGLYRLAYYMLTTLPPPDTIEGVEERRQMNEVRGALCQFIRATENHFHLPVIRKSKAVKRLERFG